MKAQRTLCQEMVWKPLASTAGARVIALQERRRRFGCLNRRHSQFVPSRTTLRQ